MVITSSFVTRGRGRRVMAASSSGFEEWLEAQLCALNTDQEIFGGYIKGILEGDETDEEKIEALEEVLAEVSEDISTLCKDIVLKWTTCHSSENNDNSPVPKFDIHAKIATLMEQQTQSINSSKKISSEDKKYREAIVAQYSQVSVEDDEILDDTGIAESGSNAAAYGDSFLVRNVNAESVVKAEKEKREKSKGEVEKKKVQDKIGREKQKQQQQERKEREKKRTQKGERRR